MPQDLIPTEPEPERTPTIQVPVDIFLELARLYRGLPQEKTYREIWYRIRALEQRAYRRLQHGRKPPKS